MHRTEVSMIRKLLGHGGRLCLSLVMTMLACSKPKTVVEQAAKLAKKGVSSASEVESLLIPEIEEHPENEEAHRLLAETYFWQSEWRKAIAQFDEVIALREKRQLLATEAWFMKAQALINSAQQEEALKVFQAHDAEFRADTKHCQDYPKLLRETMDHLLLKKALPDLQLAKDAGLETSVDRTVVLLEASQWGELREDHDLGPCIQASEQAGFQRFTLIRPLPESENRSSACIFSKDGKPDSYAIWTSDTVPKSESLQATLKPVSQIKRFSTHREVWRSITTGTLQSDQGRTFPAIVIRKGKPPKH
jgi:hypothetical protein